MRQCNSLAPILRLELPTVVLSSEGLGLFENSALVQWCHPVDVVALRNDSSISTDSNHCSFVEIVGIQRCGTSTRVATNQISGEEVCNLRLSNIGFAGNLSCAPILL